MGYLFLAITLITGAVKGFCGKKTSTAISEIKDAMFANLLRMLLCVIIGFLIILVQKDVELLKVGKEVMLISLLSGVTTSAFVVTWIMSVRKGAYMMIDVFLMLGTLIPMVSSALLFDEIIKTNQIVGFSLLLISVIIMCSYNNSIKERMTGSSFILLLLCGITNGIADFSQKLFVKNSDGYSNAVFNFYTYLFSAIVLFVCYSISCKQNIDRGVSSRKKIKSVFGYILLMSLCLFLNSYFKTSAALYLPSSELYPVIQGGGLILATLMASLFFKEKVTVKAILGISIAFIGMLTMNIT